jgi:hypothetical protein
MYRIWRGVAGESYMKGRELLENKRAIRETKTRRELDSKK